MIPLDEVFLVAFEAWAFEIVAFAVALEA